jgi:DNA-binding MarR family transcriptional regulator
MEAVTPSRRSKREREGVGRVLKRAEQRLLRAKAAALKPLGLTLAQYVALSELDSEPGITGATLARRCLVTPQAMMVVLKALEDQGLVERSAHPRHPNVLEVYITAAGREALHDGRRAVDPIERRVEKAFSARELATLESLLMRLIAAVGRDPASPPSRRS